MYIKRVTLDNVRCFDNLNVEFASAGSSALFLGDNGDGKSTILRSLAMGLCDESSAAALFRELTGAFVRRHPDLDATRSKETGTIKIDLDDEGTVYRISTIIRSLPNFERVQQNIVLINGEKTTVNQDKFPWDHIFVVGYGPGLRTRGTTDYQRYLAVDAVYPLFRYDTPLQNPELSIRRLIDTARKRGETPEESDHNEHRILKEIQSLMTVLLDLKSEEHFRLTSTGLVVDGFWGSAGLNQLGDGFQATITWVLDLISWWFLRENGKSTWDLKTLNGIVIIDEVEQHLHPRWQHRILPLLRERFPKIQFIVATHSPLVASGSGDVEVHLFEKGQQSVVKPYGWLAENVYGMMGLEDSRSTQFRQTLNRYEELDYKKIKGRATEHELAEWKELNIVVASLPEGDTVGLSLEMANIVKTLKETEPEP